MALAFRVLGASKIIKACIVGDRGLLGRSPFTSQRKRNHPTTRGTICQTTLALLRLSVCPMVVVALRWSQSSRSNAHWWWVGGDDPPSCGLSGSRPYTPILLQPLSGMRVEHIWLCTGDWGFWRNHPHVCEGIVWVHSLTLLCTPQTYTLRCPSCNLNIAMPRCLFVMGGAPPSVCFTKSNGVIKHQLSRWSLIVWVRWGGGVCVCVCVCVQLLFAFRVLG